MKFELFSMAEATMGDVVLKFEAADLPAAEKIQTIFGGENSLRQIEETELTVAAPLPQTVRTETTKEIKMLNACWCGCGTGTKSKFAPGHDARFHGAAKRFARAVAAGENPKTPVFVNDAAQADWDKWADAELPKAEAKLAAANPPKKAVVVAEPEVTAEAEVAAEPEVATVAV